MIQFKHPEILWILLLVPILAFMIGRAGKWAAMLFPSTGIASALGKSKSKNPLRLLFNLRLLAIALLVLAIARPQQGREQAQTNVSGIDIILALDVSTSMDALDFKINGREVRRVEAVKTAIERFIEDRRDDRIALIAFAAKPYLMSPLTLDKSFLLDRLHKIDTGIIEDYTAIGTALARSVRQLVDREAKSKVVVLLTDGENNRGSISPIQAAETAKTFGVRVYTIGAGTDGIAPIIAKDRFGRSIRTKTEVNIDEETLQEIASITGGKYFRATDLNELKMIYKEIDELEKTDRVLQGFSVDREWFPFLILCALLLVILEMLLANTRLLKLP